MWHSLPFTNCDSLTHSSQSFDPVGNPPSVLSPCVVTHAQAQKLEVEDLSNSFIANEVPNAMECILSVSPDPVTDVRSLRKEVDTKTCLKVDREHLAAAQRANSSLVKC